MLACFSRCTPFVLRQLCPLRQTVAFILCSFLNLEFPMTAELIHRLHFAFTITFHYLFPQLTMGLALLIVVLKTIALRTGSSDWDRASHFWGRILGINFVFGVVTGIPMEFEFGTNWARFSRASGGVIGQPLAMEGFFIIVTDAWMQHPVAYSQVDGHFEVLSFWQLLLNPWGLLQYMHNMTGATVTGSFVMAAVGAFYLLEGRNKEFARIFL